ncbi:MAG: Flp pilus assembly protein CpaB [bacterium]
MKQRVILIASVVIGLIAALLTGQYLSAKDKDYQDKLQKLKRSYRTIPVIAANRALPAGTVLAYTDMASMDVVENAVRGRVVDIKDSEMLAGKKLSRSLDKGTPIYWSDLEGGDPFNRGLAHDIKNRQRAISISVGGAAAVSGMVRPSDHVDVLGTFTFPSERKAGEMEMVTLTLLQDVLILATGRETAKNQLGANDRASGGYNTVTVEVTPREAEMLVFAEQARGRLVLTLRNPADLEYEKDLPRVDFGKIQEEIATLNRFRQEKLLGKPLR